MVSDMPESYDSAEIGVQDAAPSLHSRADVAAAKAAFAAFWDASTELFSRLTPSEQSAWVRAAKAARIE